MSREARRLAGYALWVALVAACEGGAIGSGGPFQPTDRDPVDDPEPPGEVEPGTVTMSRLNRAEYDNTVRDLFGTALRPAADFPPDDTGYGYDNIADVLTISPLHVELYEAAAAALVEDALGSPGLPETSWQREAEDLTGTTGAAGDGFYNLWSNGSVTASFEAPAAGEYRVTVRAWQTPAGPEDARMSVAIPGLPATSFTVSAVGDAPGSYEHAVRLRAGVHAVEVSFDNDYYMDPDDRNLIVDWIRFEGPTGGVPGTPGVARDAILTCTPSDGGGRDACARAILRPFLGRAWRRPATDLELASLVDLVALAEGDGGDFEDGIRLALQAALLSPHFLFRVEIDPDPTSEAPHLVGAYELASRLSYFLWSSMPDDRLLDLADTGELVDPAVLRAEAARMLADPRSRALVDNFGGQWLGIRDVPNLDPDYALFPGFSAELGASMGHELRAFFETLVSEDRPLTELVTADWSFVDARLAAFYGVPAGTGTPGPDGWRRVTLPPERQAGVLGKAAFLATTSFPRRTSPVKRGVWVLERLLCSAPPPPPPGVEGLAEGEGAEALGTLRERMEAHRAHPVCNSCHETMDAIGFGLEGFDAIGAHRTTYRDGAAVDATGELPEKDGFTGERFRGPVELGAIVGGNPNFLGCVAEQLFTYALGRGPREVDEPYLRAIAEEARSAGGHFEAVAIAIAASDPFRYRRGESPTEEESP